MKKTVLVFGLISGLLSSAMMLATLPFLHQIGFDRGAIVGYTAIVASLLVVFFGIRSYRDQVGGGAVTFGRGFTVGLLITLISCLFYVATWEVIYYKLSPGFADEWTSYALDKARAASATAAEMEATTRQMADIKTLMDNPFTNGAMAFVEPFPIGLLVTLISAAILRKKPR